MEICDTWQWNSEPSHVIGTRIDWVREIVDLQGEGSPVFWLLQQPAWLENGFETELGTFKLEME